MIGKNLGPFAKNNLGQFGECCLLSLWTYKRQSLPPQFSLNLSHPGPCPPGYYCIGGTNTEAPTDLDTHKGAACPTGHYCEGGNAAAVKCPAGQYQDNIGTFFFPHLATLS